MLIVFTEILCFSVSGEGLRLSALVLLLFLDCHLKPPFLLGGPLFALWACGLATPVIRAAAGVAQTC